MRIEIWKQLEQLVKTTLRVALHARRPDANRGYEKTSLHVSSEVLIITFTETRSEANAYASLCQVSSVVKFIRFRSTTALQHCKLLSADFSALAPARRVRFPMGREPPQGYPPVADRREAVARVVRLPPPYRFNCLWAWSFHLQFHD